MFHQMVSILNFFSLGAAKIRQIMTKDHSRPQVFGYFTHFVIENENGRIGSALSRHG